MEHDIFNNFDSVESDTQEYYYDAMADAISNLDIQTHGEIVAIADLGFWNGRRSGYKTIGFNLRNCLQTGGDIIYSRLYIDSHDLKATHCHHDGTHKIVFRELKPGLSCTQVDNFYSKILSGLCTQKEITKYTNSLREVVKNHYGW